MSYSIRLSVDANEDLAAIAKHYLLRAGADVADNILGQIQQAISSLKQDPQRGHRPHELYGTDESQVLEIIVERYRIVYLIEPNQVIVLAIFDGRQDVKSYLLKRKLHSL